MGKWLIGAMLAATAWTPMAQAQDGGWRGRHGGGDGQQARPQQAQPQQAPPQQAEPRPQGAPGGGWEGRGGWGGNRSAPQLQSQAQVGVQAQTDGGWRGRNSGGQVDAQAQARAQANGGWQGRRDWQRPQGGDPAAQGVRQQDFKRDRGRDGGPAAFARNGGGRPDDVARDRQFDARRDEVARDRNGDRRAEAFGRAGDGRQGFGYDRRGYDAGRWNNGWRRDDRYDWNRYRSYNRDAFRLPRYYAPYGWNYGYRRFSIGVVLSSSLWEQNYWIDDPYDYRLPEAYGPYRWVRYYNDALLIDLRNGVVVDTVYDIFWG